MTNLLVAWGQGDEAAFERLIPLVHAELRRIARRQMGHERHDHTLKATALVNEAYLKLIDVEKVKWQEALGVSVRTVKRDWTMAKLWLFRALKKTR